MATEKQHLAKARHNQRMLETVDPQFPDWIATVAFYAAVHLVEAGFIRQGGSNSNKHSERNRRLKQHFPGVWRKFQPLWNLSKVARYDADQLISRKTAQHIVSSSLPSLEKAIASHIK